MFPIMYRFAIKFSFDCITFSQISLYFSSNLSSFIEKRYIHLVLSKSLLYRLILGRNTHKGLFFSIFVTSEIFKILFTKRKLIRYCYLINIYIVYWNRAFMLMKYVFFNFNIIKLYNVFLSIFINGFNFFFFYNLFNLYFSPFFI